MVIRRNIKFSLKPRTYKGEKILENLPIRMRVSYNSQRLDIMTGYFADTKSWDENLERMKKNTTGKSGQTATATNAYLNKASVEIDEVFKEFELIGRYPSPEELENAFQSRMGGNPVQRKTRSKFWEALDEFTATESVTNSWQATTIQKFRALGEHIKLWKEQPRFEDFDEKGLTSFLVSMLEKEDMVNSTIQKQVEYLKWFLRWAMRKNYHRNTAYQNFKPKLKNAKKTIVFLTIAEIRKLRDFEIPATKAYLERVRDVFIFCCFTGLRHSDVYNLRRSNVKDDHIDVTTKKTGDTISIDLNDVARSILDKYKEVSFPKDKALPVISNQKMNSYLKELCQLAGFDEQIRLTYYHGSERIDIEMPKYQLIGTHQGRKSFICNALAAGIPVNVVMKWTGHSDYKSMEPYIEVADSIKAREMSKMNNLL